MGGDCTCTDERWCSKACRKEWDAMVARIADGMARKLTDAVFQARGWRS